MDRETETVINRLMSDLKAAQDLSTYLMANNKKLREALREISCDCDIHCRYDGVGCDQWIARVALKEGE